MSGMRNDVYRKNCTSSIRCSGVWFDLNLIILGANLMSKGMDSKKQGKKEPAKTMKEKRAAKKAKKESKGAMH